MFLVDSSLVADTDNLTRAWFAAMQSDAAYLYAACFTVQSYFDAMLQRTRSLEAQIRDRVLYAKTIRLLQERLSADDGSRLSNSTIMTVLTLYGHAYTTGDYESALRHHKGLLKLVSIRGMENLIQDPILLIEIVR